MKSLRPDPASVLLIIDVQNDFCPGGSLPVPDGDGVVAVINRLAPRFQRVIATQDWHPRGHVSFASSHPGAKPFDRIATAAGPQVLWPDHCVCGSRGAELHGLLDLRPVSLILRKGIRREIDSYSAFFENDRLTSTGLEFYLKGLKAGRLFLAGLATDFCVFFSALDALKLGLEAVLVEDACRGIDQPAGSLPERLAELKKAGAVLAASAQILS